MVELSLNALRVVYLPGSHPEASRVADYRKAYEMWCQVWTQFFRDLPEARDLFADQFTRQEEIAALFHGEQCIGMSFFRWVDFNLVDQTRDSYFKLWGKADLESLLREGSMICVPSFLTVSPDFRRDRCNFDVRRLVLGLVTKRFEASTGDAMPVVTRNAKGVNEVFYSMGAQPIRKDVVNFHAEDLVDLVVTYRSTIKYPVDEPFRGVLERTWDSRTFAAQERPHLFRKAREFKAA